MSTALTGKQRLGAVLAAAWVLFCFFSIEPWRYDRDSGAWERFLACGIGPIAVILAVMWVYRGFRNDRNRRS